MAKARATRQAQQKRSERNPQQQQRKERFDNKGRGELREKRRSSPLSYLTYPRGGGVREKLPVHGSAAGGKGKGFVQGL